MVVCCCCRTDVVSSEVFTWYVAGEDLVWASNRLLFLAFGNQGSETRKGTVRSLAPCWQTTLIVDRSVPANLTALILLSSRPFPTPQSSTGPSTNVPQSRGSTLEEPVRCRRHQPSATRTRHCDPGRGCGKGDGLIHLRWKNVARSLTWS